MAVEVDYNTILKKVGKSLLAIGVIDICIMIVCIVRGVGYGSFFNVFAVTAGLYLMKSSLKTANIVARFSGFVFGGFLIGMIYACFATPFDLLQVYFKLYSWRIIIFLIIFIALEAYMAWIYRSLTDKVVIDAMKEKNIPINLPFNHSGSGFLFVLVVFGALYVSSFFLPKTGKYDDRILREAKAEVGDGYKFHITSTHISSDYSKTEVSAKVAAYTSDEIKTVEVKWEE